MSMSDMLAIPPPRQPCPGENCNACYVITHPRGHGLDKTQIHAIDIYRCWELIAGFAPVRHRRTPWIMVAPFLESKGYVLEDRSLVSREPEEDDLPRLKGIHALVQHARDRRGRSVVIKALGVNSPNCPELRVWHKLASREAMKDARNHTLPVIKFIRCNPKFPGIKPDILDHREFVVTPKFSVLETWPSPECFQPSDIRATLDLFYQALEGIDYMHCRRIAHGDIGVHNMLMSQLADGTTRFYFMDFELSSISESKSSKSLVLARRLISNAAPEQSLKIPYDPFANDMYATGMFLDKYVNESGAVDDAQLSWDKVPKIKELILSLFAKNPRDRPTAFEALRIIMHLQRTLPEDVLNINLKRIQPVRHYPHVYSYENPANL